MTTTLPVYVLYVVTVALVVGVNLLWRRLPALAKNEQQLTNGIQKQVIDQIKDAYELQLNAVREASALRANSLEAQVFALSERLVLSETRTSALENRDKIREEWAKGLQGQLDKALRLADERGFELQRYQAQTDAEISELKRENKGLRDILAEIRGGG